jgi:hypothetical protein
MRTVKTTYLRAVFSKFDGYHTHDAPIEIEAECEAAGDEVTVIWTDACRAKLAALDLDCEELVGCEEAMIAAFDAGEQEACRIEGVQQRIAETPPELLREQIAFVALSAIERLEQGAA